MRQTSIDYMTVLYWIIGFVLSAAVVWLGIVPLDEIQRALFIFGFGLVLVLIMFYAGRGRFDPSGPLSGAKLPATGIGLLLLAANSWALQRWLGLSFYVPSVILVAGLFAIYEETGLLGIRMGLKGIGMPDYYVLALEVVLFVPLHAFAYPLELTVYIVFLVIGRAIMSGSALVTDAASVAYNIHVVWNVIQAGLLTWLLSLLTGGLIG